MPLIQVKLTEDVFTPEQKAEVIAKLTQAIVGIKLRHSVTLVVIEEEPCSEADLGIEPVPSALFSSWVGEA